MKKSSKVFSIICLLILTIMTTACFGSNVPIPTEQEVLAKVTKEVAGENFVLTGKKEVRHQNISSNGSSGEELVKGYEYTFKSSDRDLYFGAEAGRYLYSDGLPHYESDIYVDYWSAVYVTFYADKFKEIVKSHFDDSQLSFNQNCRIEVKDVSDIDEFVTCYNELNDYYYANEAQYHNGELQSLFSIKLYSPDQKNTGKSTENAYSKSYYINGKKEDIRSELESDFIEQIIDKDIDIPGFDKEKYTEDYDYKKNAFSKIYINSHQMTFTESRGLVKNLDYKIDLGDDGKYYVILCEYEYDATGTMDTGGKYSMFSHYLNTIHSETGIDYYADFKEELNKDKFYSDGEAITVFAYTIDNSDYEIEFVAEAQGINSTMTAKKDGSIIPIDYYATDGRFYYVNIDDFCKMLNLTWQIENVDEMHFYTN